MIRLITGRLGGRKLDVPPSKISRPTTDRVRESIFNLLESHMVTQGIAFENLTVLDAFAGSGALGFEALSRGATHITFFDPAPPALKILQQNAATLECQRSDVKIQRVDATKPPKVTKAVGLIFMDPPYEKGMLRPAYEALLKNGWITGKTLLVFETSSEEELPPFFEPKIQVQRVYGITKITLLTGDI